MTQKNINGNPLKSRVYEEIKTRIINCRMMPGEPIFEDKLCEEFHTSRTPVREALLQLRRERLVEIYSRKGTFVREIILKDVYEIYQMRLIIEPGTAVLVRPVLARERLENFKARFIENNPDKHDFFDNFRIDREFHDYIIESANNKYLFEVYSDLLDLNQRLRILSGRDKKRFWDGITEHSRIIDALLEGDDKEIVEAISSHILNSRTAALNLEGFLRP